MGAHLRQTWAARSNRFLRDRIRNERNFEYTIEIILPDIYLNLA